MAWQTKCNAVPFNTQIQAVFSAYQSNRIETESCLESWGNLVKFYPRLKDWDCPG